MTSKSNTVDSSKNVCPNSGTNQHNNVGTKLSYVHMISSTSNERFMYAQFRSCFQWEYKLNVFTILPELNLVLILSCFWKTYLLYRAFPHFYIYFCNTFSRWTNWDHVCIQFLISITSPFEWCIICLYLKR